MKGLFFPGERHVAVEEYPDPEPGPGEVVLKMKASGICGSDLYWGYRTSREDTLKLIEKQGKIIHGHEPSGTIDKIGECVDNLRVGDRVMAYHASGCGFCPDCLDGFQQYCTRLWNLGLTRHGGFADSMLTRAVSCIKLRDELSFEDGAISACAGGTAYQILRDLALSSRDEVAIFGLGPLGLCAILTAKATGARVLAVDIVEERLRLAKKLGADELINGKEKELSKSIKSLTEGKGATLSVDFSGSHEAQNNAIDCLRRNGRVGFIGASGEPVELLTVDIGKLRLNRLRMAGNWIFTMNTADEMLDFAARRNIHFDRIVTHRFPLERAQEAFGVFDSGKTGKVMFVWR